MSIQSLAQINICHHLAPFTENEVIQVVVDLGLSEGFRGIYSMYTGTSRGLKSIKMFPSIKDEDISIPNFRKLPAPTFMISEDSRILQLSDLIIGKELAKAVNDTNPFAVKINELLKPIDELIDFRSVEWNKDKE